jgi:NitT/TauT family transport system ATP-binding protein
VLNILELNKEYTQNGRQSLLALSKISFEARQGEFLSLVGPSGCGKTTLLMCIAGLMKPSSGKVMVDGIRITEPPRQMVLIFQNYSNSLFPWRTVLGNIMFALENKPVPHSQQLEIAEGLLHRLGLADFGRHYPWELSGGMQQRVAIARGLAYGSEIILMDEPFASVDAQTRADLEDFLLSVWQTYEKTVLFVTHDIDEAVYLSDRVIVLSSRPSVVLGDISIDLERPRDQLKTKADERFIKLRNTIYGMIRR